MPAISVDLTPEDYRQTSTYRDAGITGDVIAVCLSAAHYATMSRLPLTLTPEQERLLTEIGEAGDEHEEVVRNSLRLKWLPGGCGNVMIRKEEVERFLELSHDEQREIIRKTDDDDVDFWIDLLIARARWVPPVDRNPGSITQERLDTYPERYRWEP